MCGAVSVKPTVLLAVHCDQLRALVNAAPNRGRCNHAYNTQQVLTGTLEDGSFRTAAAKQYPPALCSLLARAAWHHNIAAISPLAEGVGSPAPEDELAALYVPLDPYYDGQGWGQYGSDYRPG